MYDNGNTIILLLLSCLLYCGLYNTRRLRRRCHRPPTHYNVMIRSVRVCSRTYDIIHCRIASRRKKKPNKKMIRKKQKKKTPRKPYTDGRGTIWSWTTAVFRVCTARATKRKKQKKKNKKEKNSTAVFPPIVRVNMQGGR